MSYKEKANQTYADLQELLQLLWNNLDTSHKEQIFNNTKYTKILNLYNIKEK